MSMSLVSSPPFPIDGVVYNSTLIASSLIGVAEIVDITSQAIIKKLGIQKEAVRNGITFGMGLVLVSALDSLQAVVGEADSSAISMGLLLGLGFSYRFLSPEDSSNRLYTNATILSGLLTASFAAANQYTA